VGPCGKEGWPTRPAVLGERGRSAPFTTVSRERKWVRVGCRQRCLVRPSRGLPASCTRSSRTSWAEHGRQPRRPGPTAGPRAGEGRSAAPCLGARPSVSPAHAASQTKRRGQRTTPEAQAVSSRRLSTLERLAGRRTPPTVRPGGGRAGFSLPLRSPSTGTALRGRTTRRDTTACTRRNFTCPSAGSPVRGRGPTRFRPRTEPRG